MRIDSRLMKTDMELASIERQDDRLLMKSPPEDWNATKVYLSPHDVVNTVRLSLHRGMIGYVLMFPFFLVAHYLRREKDISPFVYDIGYIVAAETAPNHIFAAYYYTLDDGNGFGGTRFIAGTHFTL